MFTRTLFLFGASAVATTALAAPSSSLYEVHTLIAASGGEALASVAVDAQGKAWLTDGKDTVYTLEAGGSLTVFSQGAAKGMDAVRIAPDGSIVVSGDPVTGWAPDGSPLWSITCGVEDPQGMDIGSDGMVYLANHHEICEVDPSTGTADYLGNYQRVVQGLGVDRETGDLFAVFGTSSSPDRTLERLDPVTGVSVKVIAGAGQAFSHTGVADYGDRGAVVADRGTNSVLLFDEAGHATELATGFQSLSDVSVGADGHLYVTDAGGVYRIDRDPDRDGIDSLDDACLDTPAGARVRADGCSGLPAGMTWTPVSAVTGGTQARPTMGRRAR